MEAHSITQRTLNDDTIIISPGKTLDNNNAHEMVDVITSAQSRGFKYLIVDMTVVEFLSSSGVGSILGTVEVSRELGGDIILCNLSETVAHVFDVLDLTDYLTIRTSEKEAAEVCGVNL